MSVQKTTEQVIAEIKAEMVEPESVTYRISQVHSDGVTRNIVFSVTSEWKPTYLDTTISALARQDPLDNVYHKEMLDWWTAGADDNKAPDWPAKIRALKIRPIVIERL